MAKDNKILKQPEILTRIAEVRKKFAGSEEEAIKFKDWEDQAKKALLVLSMEGHEGIQIMIDKAREEIKQRNSIIKTIRPADFTPDGLAEYALANSFHFQVIDLYTWFISLFADAKDVLADIDREVLAEAELQEQDES